MSVETLKIVIEAENKKALAALRETAQAGESVGRKLGESAKNAGSFSISLQDLNVRLSLLKERLMQATNPALIQRIDGQIRATTKQIEVQEAAYAKLGVTSLQSTNATTNALSKSFGALTRIAYLVPGLGIAGIFNLGFEAIGKAAKELGIFSSKLSEAEKNLKNLNDVQAEASKQAGEDLTRAKLLYQAATDVNLSIRDRVKAAQELKNEYPELLKNFSKESIAAGDARSAYDLLTESIISNARAKAAAAKIGEIQGKILDAEYKALKIRNALSNELSRSKDTRSTDLEGNTTETTAAQQRAGAFVRAKKGFEELKKEISGYVAEQKFLEESIGKQKLEKGAIGTGKTAGLDATKLTDLQKILKTLSEELKGIQALEEIGAKGFEDAKVDRVKAYNKAIEDMAKIGLTQASEKFKELLAARDAFFKSSGNGGIIKKEDLVFLPREAQIGQNTTQNISGQSQAQKAIELASATTKAKNAQDHFNVSIKDTEKIMGVLGPEIDHVFDSLLRGESIGSTLGNVFKDLAIQIAKAAIKAAIFQAILSTFTGGASSALGAVGGKNSGGFFGSFKKLLGFADGGIASGPKSGYPVMLHGTEAIFNGTQLRNLVNNVSASSRMNTAGLGNNSVSELASQISSLKNSMTNNQQQQVQIVPFMKGPDLQLIVNRGVQQNLRYY